MMKQRKITKVLGRDTHVRNNIDNIFTPENHASSQLLIGEVLYPEPEPLFKQNTVTVKLANGGQITNVAIPNAFISPVTYSLHGLYEGLSPGQMVSVGFNNNNQASPIIVNRYPYQGVGNTLLESSYITPTVVNGIGNLDVAIGHLSGSILQFNSGVFPNLGIPGSITLSSVTSLDLSSTTTLSINSLLGMTIDGLSIKIESSLGAIVNCDATGLVQIKNASQSMLSLIQTLYNTILTAIDTAAGSGQAATIAAEVAKWALLLKS